MKLREFGLLESIFLAVIAIAVAVAAAVANS